MSQLLLNWLNFWEITLNTSVIRLIYCNHATLKTVEWNKQKKMDWYWRNYEKDKTKMGSYYFRLLEKKIKGCHGKMNHEIS